MRRRWIAVLAALACAACAREQAVAWVPELVVHARLAVDARTNASGVAWQVGGGARWALSRAPAPREPAPREEVAPPTGASACASNATCAWERLERARALEATRSLARRRR